MLEPAEIYPNVGKFYLNMFNVVNMAEYVCNITCLYMPEI